MGAIIGILVAIFFIGGIAALVIYAVRQGKKQMHVAGALHEELNKLFAKPWRYGPSGAREIRAGSATGTIVLLPGGKNTPPTLRVSVPIEVRTAGAKIEHGAYRNTARRRVAGKLPVLFRKETSNDRFGKRLGLNVEHHTQDTAFDEEVYIESDAREGDLEALLSDATTRQAIHQILSMGFTSVELFRGSAVVQASATRPTAEIVTRTAEVAERLGLIAENLPAFDASPVGRAAPLGTAIAASVGMIGGFAAFVFGVVAATKFPIVVAGAVLNLAVIGLAAWVLTCVASFFLIRGRSDALRMYAFVFFSGLFGLPALSVGVGAATNGFLDTGAPTAHDARITRRWITTSKNSKTHHLEVESWRSDTRRIEFTVSSSLYGAVYEGALVRVNTKPGKLGWEWIDGIQQVTQPSKQPSGVF